MTLISNKQIIADNWRLLDETHPTQPGNSIVSLQFWLDNKEHLGQHQGELGLLLSGDENPEAFCNELNHFSLIVIEIPNFVDGRAYSLAQLIRTRYQFGQEIRAIGDVLPDQAGYLFRVGFSSLQFSTQELATLALSKLNDFSHHYQPAI